METRKTTALCLMLLLCMSLQAQMTSQQTFRRYTTQDGLPQMQTERLWQDTRGYIYIGTLSGFVRFDGRTLTPLLKGRRENIVGFAEVEGQVRALGFRRQWLISYDDVQMQPIDPQGQWLLNNLNANALPDGYVLLENEQEEQRRLCRVTARGFELRLRGRLLDALTPDRKLYADAQGAMIPTPQGLYRVRWGQRHATLLTRKGDIYTLLRTDSALLAFAADGIYQVSGNSLTRVTAANWTEAAFGLTVRQLRDGTVAIADEHTVYLFDGRAVRPMTTGINLIRDLLADRWDRLWVATYQGVYCFFNRCFTNHTLTDRNDIVRAVATASDDRLILGTLNGKVITRDATGRTTVVSNDSTQYYGSSTTVIGRQVFMPVHDDVAAVTTDQPTAAVHPLQLPRDRYRFLTQTDGRLILVSQQQVISAYDPLTGRTDTLTTKIPYPWCAAFDDTGRLWAGGTMGVYTSDGNGEPVKAEYPQRLLVTTMEADARGTVFFASADSLFCIRQGVVSDLTCQLPLLRGHEIRQLHVTRDSHLVVAAVDALIVCRISNDYRMEDARLYDHHNGFTMVEPLMATMAESSDGTVWLPGVEEMTSFRPAELLRHNEEDTYVSPPLHWWQHWWVWLTALVLFAAAVWAVTRRYEKRRNRRKMIRLQREKLARERQIDAIRQKAISEAGTTLAKDIVRMTERTAEGRLTLRTASGTLVAEVSDIAYFKGDGNYSQIVTFHTHDTVLTGLGALEKLLDAETFVRADRSTLVNIHNICNLLPKQRRCIFRSPDGKEVETTLLTPAFKRLQGLI